MAEVCCLNTCIPLEDGVCAIVGLYHTLKAISNILYNFPFICCKCMFENGFKLFFGIQEVQALSGGTGTGTI